VKILIVNCVFPPEPVVSATIGESLSDILAEVNDVSVVVPNPSRPHGFEFEALKNSIGKYKLQRLKSYVHPRSGVLGRLGESISFGISSYNYIIKNGFFDRVYMNTWPLFAQLAVALACKKKAIPYFVHVQDIYPESLVNKLPSYIKHIALFLLLPVDRYVLRNASAVIAISENMRKHLNKTRNVPTRKIQVVSNWQNEKDFLRFQENYPLENEKLTFMYLGNIGPVAGLDFLIEAFAKSKCEGKLVIAGAGSEKNNCKKIAESFPMSDIVFIEVPQGKVPETQSKSHILILSTQKNTGNNSIPSKLPAYMLSARPILALADRNSDIAQAIQDADCGWIGNPEDEVWLIDFFKNANKISLAELKQKGQMSLIYAKKFYSRERNLKKLKNIILS